MRKRKVLLVTVQGYFNYGNRLQNYALQEMLKDLGFEVHTLMAEEHLRTYSKDKWKFYIKYILTTMGVKHFVISYSDTMRRRRLFNFTKQYIDHLEFIDNREVWNKNWDEYACVVTGSDQVWHNWNTMDRELEFYYLEFVDKEKRVAYAPSFGFTSFPKEDEERHRRGLLELSALSCREKEGCDIIYALCGRSAERLLDPTLVLVKERWEAFEKRPSFIAHENGYVLVYLLGEYTEEYRSIVEETAAQKHLEVINVSDITTPKYYSVSPNEFVWLIHHAGVVCTDSFHGTVFALQFEKEITVFERKQAGYEQMFGRIRDLVQALHMEHILFGYDTGREETSYALSDSAKSYLANEREKAYRFLSDSIPPQ